MTNPIELTWRLTGNAHSSWRWRDGNGPWTDGIGNLDLAIRSAENGVEVEVSGHPIASWIQERKEKHEQAVAELDQQLSAVLKMMKHIF